MREIGAVFSGEADMATELVLPDGYEAVLYVEATTPEVATSPPQPPDFGHFRVGSFNRSLTPILLGLPAAATGEPRAVVE